MEIYGKLFNVAAILHRGNILGLVPKTHIPTYAEFYEGRHFTSGPKEVTQVHLGEKMVPFGSRQLFVCDTLPELKVAAEICEDLWVPCPPSTGHAMAGATLIVNLSASDEMTGKDSYRRMLVSSQSASLICGYIYATAGEGESSTDLVFGGHSLIAENGSLLAEAERFKNQTICSEVDVYRLVGERRKMTTYPTQDMEGYQVTEFSQIGRASCRERV